MSTLVTADDFRLWAGVSAVTVPDSLIQQCLDEAESGLLADLGDVDILDVKTSKQAKPVATGEVLRRAARFLARRNSPESIAGTGDFSVIVPSRDPDSQRAVWALTQILGLDVGVA